MVMMQRKIRSGNKPPALVGLTGGIGSGKSSVAAWFSTLGIPVVDTDMIAHHLTTSNGEAMPVIRETFGEKFVTTDGNLDRAMMRKHIFANPADKKKLEAIMHPMIREGVIKELKNNRYAPYIVVDIPLLCETGFFKEKLTRILVIETRLDLQIQRAIDRSRLSLNEVKQILKAQATNPQRREIATDIIVNNDTLDELYREVTRIHQRYLTEL